MQRIKSLDNTASMPDPDVNSYDPGYFQDGNAAIGRKGTVVSATWANGVQEEIIKVITEAGITPSEADNTQLWQALRRMIFEASYPVGSIYISARNISPVDLFGFGTWEKIEGRVLLGAGTGYALGGTGGAASVTLNVSNMPAHAHDVSCAAGGAIPAQVLETEQDGAHSHTITVQANTHAHAASAVTCQNAGDHKHGRGTYEITGSFFGADFCKDSVFTGAFSRDVGHDAFDGIYTVSHDMTKTVFRASGGWSGQSGSAGAHGHAISISASGSHDHQATCATGAKHRHSITVPAAEAHTHALTIGSRGNGQAFSVLPPYKAVNIWQRTA